MTIPQTTTPTAAEIHKGEKTITHDHSIIPIILKLRNTMNKKNIGIVIQL